MRLSARAIAAGQPLGIESACVYGGAPREMQISRLAEGVMIATDCVYGGAPREMQISRLAEGVMIATDDLG